MITAAMMIPISAAPVQISASCGDESIAMNIKRPNRTIASALRSVISFMIPQKIRPKVRAGWESFGLYPFGMIDLGRFVQKVA